MESLFSNTNSRHNYHVVDYNKMRRLLESEAEIACAIDSDMYIYSENVYYIVPHTKKYGSCIPINSRGSLFNDIKQGLDSYMIDDESGVHGPALNITPLTLNTKSEVVRKFYEKSMQKLLERLSHCSIAMWKASWELNYNPLILPPQWCLCRGQEGYWE